MYIGFNLQLDKTANIFNRKISYNDLKKQGKNHLDEQRANYEKELEKYVKRNEVDGTQIQEDWFPEIEADIFISHSHKDEGLACALAGWINQTFGLRCFIDSNVWGYSSVLLDSMNGKLSNKRKNKQGGFTYSYKSCNQVSQHVNTMLSIALQKMIDKVEVVIFLNTDNAVKICSDTAMEKTYSPWIYSEIVYTQLVRKKPLLAYRNYTTVIEESSDMPQNIQFAINLVVSYTVSLKHLVPLNEVILYNWRIEYIASKQSYEYSLDALYKFICSDEVDTTKRLFARLKKEDLDSLRQIYSVENTNSKERENMSFGCNRILNRCCRRCLECDCCIIND